MQRIGAELISWGKSIAWGCDESFSLGMSRWMSVDGKSCHVNPLASRLGKIIHVKTESVRERHGILYCLEGVLAATAAADTHSLVLVHSASSPKPLTHLKSESWTAIDDAQSNNDHGSCHTYSVLGENLGDAASSSVMPNEHTSEYGLSGEQWT